LPGFLLVVAAVPLWGALRGRPAVGAALRGVNAAVVGLLLAALYSPVWTSAIRQPADAARALVAFTLLTLSTMPWLVVALTGVSGVLLAHV
jgi:chromate transporter